jgi:hypothetical protein
MKITPADATVADLDERLIPPQRWDRELLHRDLRIAVITLINRRGHGAERRRIGKRRGSHHLGPYHEGPTGDP